MSIHITQAQQEDAAVVAMLVGELLHEIMASVNDKAFNFHYADTEARARLWLRDGCYSVLLAHADDVPIGFLALYQSYALYTEGIYGTIPEFYIRPAHRSKGVGAALLEQARRLGRSRGWRRLEATTPPLPQFDRTLAFYRREGFGISGGRKLKLELA
jgi:GNAT superfamily N-acetyltransferase